MYSATGTSRDNAILQRLNLVQGDLYNSPRFWRTLESYTDLSTTDGIAYNTLPADVGSVFDLRQITTAPYVKLTYLNPLAFHELAPQPTLFAESKPTHYTWWGGRLWWYPIPDTTYTITMYYYKKPTDMKLYTTGTASVGGSPYTAITGVTSLFSSNANVDTNMYFVLTGDMLSNGTYPWSTIATVGSDTSLTLAAAYTGAKTGTAYACSSAPTFSAEFDSYLIYAATLLEIGRLRETSELRGWLQEQLNAMIPGLIRNQTCIPDYTPEMQNFQRQPLAVGDDVAKFPFLQG